MTDKYWACAHCHANEEPKALRHLRLQGYEAFFPFFIFRSKYRHLQIKPVFPGYVFLHLEEDLAWSSINNTYGVQKLLTITSTRDYKVPWHVPDEFMESLARHIVPSAQIQGDVIAAGMKVKVLRGAFEKHEAFVQWKRADRVGLLLSVMGRNLEIVFSVDDVVSLEGAVAA